MPISIAAFVVAARAMGRCSCSRCSPAIPASCLAPRWPASGRCPPSSARSMSRRSSSAIPGTVRPQGVPRSPHSGAATPTPITGWGPGPAGRTPTTRSKIRRRLQPDNAPLPRRGGQRRGSWTPEATANAVLNALKDISGGRGKGRGNDPHVRTSYTPYLSTSNVSVPQMLRAITRLRVDDFSYIDRLLDIPAPAGGHGFFENLHGLRRPGQVPRPPD